MQQDQLVLRRPSVNVTNNISAVNTYDENQLVGRSTNDRCVSNQNY